MTLKEQERSDGVLGLFMLEGSIDDLIEYLKSKKEEDKTEFEVGDEGYRGDTDYVLTFK